ncbi:hypothetical protein CDAR_281121 [Caerostris darwini]|uniref:Uncharacterized protein n=1 Tax=Caerostris darwini TaxID=1538125 RepID=A0AAV4NCN7_9ARAC|nr:hypothetical protein CDAR_281121 [Caerostris darwini]
MVLLVIGSTSTSLIRLTPRLRPQYPTSSRPSLRLPIKILHGAASDDYSSLACPEFAFLLWRTILRAKRSLRCFHLFLGTRDPQVVLCDTTTTRASRETSLLHDIRNKTPDLYANDLMPPRVKVNHATFGTDGWHRLFVKPGV